ncbi:MAG TPA: flavin reductase family protein [Hyphomicrobium zavarzinii]|nr:flavin reductase family protein [Hyphomicrobium zavarzinii]
MISSDTFREAMSRFAGAVTAITTKGHHGPAGLIATSVCSLSADPPTLLICINRSASAHDAIVQQGLFGVSLPSREQAHVAHRFTSCKGADRFMADDWTTLVTGAPILRGASVAFDCRLVARYDAYTHTILVGLIQDVVIEADQSKDCLIWYRRTFANVQLVHTAPA